MPLRTIFLTLVLLAVSATLRAQIPAPGAYSHFAGCGQSTCVWVPFNTHKTFHRGSYSYYVKAAERGGVFHLQRDGKPFFQTRLPELSASVSVSWAPDNSGFSVTWSDGGSSGTYHVKVFLIRKGKVVKVPAASNAYADFQSLHYCTKRATGDNIQVYHWINANNLLLVTSVAPVSFCGSQMGYTQGYIVRAKTGDILKRLTPRQLTTYTNIHPQ